MRPYKRIILASLLLLILLAAPIARAHDGGGGDNGSGDQKEHTGNLVLHSGNLTVVFEGQKPKLRISSITNARQVFEVEFSKLIEFNNTNGNLAFQSKETVQRASLEAANFSNSGFFNITGGVAINFTTHQLFIEPAGDQLQKHSLAPMHGGDSKDNNGHLANVDVTFETKIFRTNTTKTFMVGNSTFTVKGGVEVKIDVFIAHWPFLTLKNRLALRIDLESSINKFQVHENDGDHQINANETKTDQHEHDIKEDEHEGTVQILTQSGLVGGFFRFVKTALTDGKPTPVAASFRVEQDDEQQTENEFKLFLSYHSFNNTLEHDPSFGINPAALGSASTFATFTPLALVALSSTAAVLLVSMKRRRTI